MRERARAAGFLDDLHTPHRSGCVAPGHEVAPEAGEPGPGLALEGGAGDAVGAGDARVAANAAPCRREHVRGDHLCEEVGAPPPASAPEGWAVRGRGPIPFAGVAGGPGRRASRAPRAARDARLLQAVVVVFMP